MKKLFGALLSVLYPNRCPSCTAIVDNNQNFCPSCSPHVHPISFPLCSCCGIPFVVTAGPNHRCGQCLTNPPAFRQARAWAHYQYGAGTLQPVSDAIQHFKYHRDLSVGKTLATLAVSQYPFASETYDVIIPVPLHLKRLRWRGFNQALVLSQALSATHGVPVDPFLLERNRPTVPQTQLTGRDRRINVKGAFTVTAPHQIKGKRILLVDDVYTSGATVHECAQTLMHGDAQLVDVFTLARAIS